MPFGQFAEPSRAPVAVAEMEGEALEKALVWHLRDLSSFSSFAVEQVAIQTLPFAPRPL